MVSPQHIFLIIIKFPEKVKHRRQPVSIKQYDKSVNQLSWWVEREKVFD